jgi:RNA polymerase sigma-70 factor (ECF subfamily)
MNLERLIDDWRGPLIGLLASWGLSWDAAREIAEDVFAEAFLGRERFRGSFDDSSKVGPWLVGIARNLRRAHARREARQKTTDLEGVEPESPDPTRTTDDDDRARLVRAAVERLSEEHRQVIYVCYFEERSVRYAAALLEISEKAVEGRLYRARFELRRRLRELETIRKEVPR